MHRATDPVKEHQIVKHIGFVENIPPNYICW